MIYFMGVDPGMTGAFAIITDEGNFVRVEDWQDPLWPVLQQTPFNIPRPWGWVDVKLAVIEKVWAMPKQGVSSSFHFGENFGAWKMALQALGVPFMVEATTKIRKILDSSVPHKPSKEDLRQYAIRRFPDAAQFLTRKGDHGRAEALVMALYARSIYGQH